MTPAARLQATIELMHEVDSIARPADAVVSAWFRVRRYIHDKDRGQVLELLYALLRHHARLGWWLARHGREGMPRNRLLAWLMLKEGKTADQIKRLFNGAKFAPATLKDQEHALLVKLQGCTIDHPGMPEDVRLECPSWAADPLRRRFREAFGQEMAALLTPAPLDLRVNPIRSTREAMLGALKDLGLRAEASAMAPYGIRVHERPSLVSLPMLRTGEVEIQDEGSQLVAMLVDARPGERVVDFCAGAGGKTLAIAAQMNNKGYVVACDVMEGRLKRGAERFRQAGLHNIETRLLASETDRWIKRHKGGFDRVLVDAPCSGTGTWRRNPDARWRAQEEQGLDKLVSLQGRILASAARLVKPGGRLVYATCSMLPAENEDQVAAFLAAHPAFRAMPLREAAPQLTNSAHPDYLSLTPARHDTDGFFAAIMQREAALLGGAAHSHSRSIS
ncbi:RsmB/NOP family class I SAM-dependent RNA methyltransferase [Mesorhizobium sp. M2D.F.Ca.ET.185.01.1.1]|nr:RsmB/NOP family class I SAM-dependent RNA methyltransferase [Mesorhizobium sp. M2D.F.Ca.ET.140.01.1.1]TGP18778.1 RsmB/NOP family class I SAM-dependent RNA methyltransferase [Mesorhizobium sp. M2D.F.Ca.ET.233.01.1.1]TGP36046.1 RsmB/NOP family class I SAM-dependent RNA methyltransferase [Mesorhizobium sp. M2D.F.Ca.ET.232.01.1.1]TGP61549.1 RsmB/NOP family class I SAM-dependent RNA methyltransferase [Mesorhizobium sp. M2D.F.Ca.ET.226.01.1.1]TGP70827.1 RsmB/NOP family class I SAM-dependent RNA me